MESNTISVRLRAMRCPTTGEPKLNRKGILDRLRDMPPGTVLGPGRFEDNDERGRYRVVYTLYVNSAEDLAKAESLLQDLVEITPVPAAS